MPHIVNPLICTHSASERPVSLDRIATYWADNCWVPAEVSHTSIEIQDWHGTTGRISIKAYGPMMRTQISWGDGNRIYTQFPALLLYSAD